MKVAVIMSEKVFQVTPDDLLGAIHSILENVQFHHLMVVEEEKLVGIISDRDILNAISPVLDRNSKTSGADILKQKVRFFMSRNLVTIPRDATIREAAQRILEHQISCLPVVNPEGGVDGIVSWKDILAYYTVSDGL